MKVLRAVDVTGTAAQLRNQLGIVYESVRTYADRPVETVVGGDSISWVKATDLLQTGILQPKIDEMIRKLDDGSADGRLSARICAVVFLINKLPREAGANLGVRATADVRADLLRAECADLKNVKVIRGNEIAGMFMRDRVEEAAVAPEFIAKVIDPAETAGGEAPRPEKPNLTTVKEIKALTGNEQLVKLYEERDALTNNLTDWTSTA